MGTELVHKQGALSLLRKRFASLFGLYREVCWQLVGSSDVDGWAGWLTGSHVIGRVFGLVGECISLLLTNQHLEEEPPIVEMYLCLCVYCVLLSTVFSPSFQIKKNLITKNTPSAQWCFFWFVHGCTLPSCGLIL